jgi:hypothetical protein
MKAGADKTKKEHKLLSGRASSSVCGTLSYIAECRGVMRKTPSSRWAAPPDDVNRTERK